MINKSIFKSYDIRGIYPSELDNSSAYLIGRAFAKKVKVDKIVVASDTRLSGPSLKEKLIAGIIDEGVDVIDIGLMPIDAVYFSISNLNYPAGIMITASHNTKEYNGFKMVLSGMRFLSGEDLYQDILKLKSSLALKRGKVVESDILSEYLKHLLSFCNLSEIRPQKIVVDASNGMAGKIITGIARHLPIKIIPLNFELNGDFPSHPPNPLIAESQVQIKQAVAENQADWGVIFDGDADRIFFMDEKGEFIRADYILLILAQEFLKREPYGGIVYNSMCSKIVPEKIVEWGGKPFRSKVGYINVSLMMQQNNCIVGGEFSGHYFFRDNNFADSGLIVWLILLQLISQRNQPLSTIIEEYKKYFRYDDNLEITGWKRVESKIKNHYYDGKQNNSDGLTIEYNDWWFNIRPSNTEPLLRVVVEANTKELLQKKVSELRSFISGIG